MTNEWIRNSCQNLFLLILGHRDRFRTIFAQLKSFFNQARNLQYFVNLITVPKLPENAPNFSSQVDFGAYTPPGIKTYTNNLFFTILNLFNSLYQLLLCLNRTQNRWLATWSIWACRHHQRHHWMIHLKNHSHRQPLISNKSYAIETI